MDELLDEPAEEYPLAGELADELDERPTAGCPTSGLESPPRDAWEKEDRVVIYASEDEIDHLC